VALALHRSAAVRVIAAAIAVVIVGVWVMFRHGPVDTATAEAAVSRPIGQLQEVRSIAFDGNRVMAAQLREVIRTRPGQPLDPGRLGRDRDAMERALSDLGYLAARVDPARVTYGADGAAYVAFAVDQGALFHLRNVQVTGAGRDATVVTLATGDDAVRARIERARAELADALARRGRPAQVELSLHTDVAAAAVDVVLATR
jgi:outer membrane protein assembly factor BamA